MKRIIARVVEWFNEQGWRLRTMNHIEKINAHLAHAKEKHPHFSDALDYGYSVGTCKDILENERFLLDKQIENGKVIARKVLECELAEVYEAIANGRAGDAVEECYDACAVLLRMAEWIAERGCK